MGALLPRVWLIDNPGSGAPDAATLQAYAAAAQKGLDGDFARAYGRSAFFAFGDAKDTSPGDLVLDLVATMDQPGALGDHAPDGSGKISPLLDAQDGAALSQTIDHELKEMLEDLLCDVIRQSSDGRMWANECCLAGDTKIQMADGSLESIEGLVRGGGDHLVVAMGNTGRKTIAIANSAHLTKKNADCVRVRFAGGSVACTPDHRFMMIDGSYRRADELGPGDLLASDVGPCLAPPGPIDRTERHAEFASELRSGLSTRQDDPNVGIRQLGAALFLSANVPVAGHSTLSRSVGAILDVGTKREVGGVYAGPNITRMANLQSAREIGVHLQPHKPRQTQAVSDSDDIALPDLSVSRARHRTDPEPAPVCLLNPGPEALSQRRRSAIVSSDPSGKWISVPLPARPMSSAPTASSHWPRASWDRAPHAKVVYAVERIGKRDVFDMTVPIHHNFVIAGDVFAHNCDAVESDPGLVIDGVTLSNFVLPSWYNGTGSKFDALGTLKAPLTVSPGGYCQYLDPTAGWQQIQSSELAPRTYRTKHARRRLRRVAKWLAVRGGVL
jgi:intein-like protein with splicing domain